jgi:hypothetical protein
MRKLQCGRDDRHARKTGWPRRKLASPVNLAFGFESGRAETNCDDRSAGGAMGGYSDFFIFTDEVFLNLREPLPQFGINLADSPRLRAQHDVAFGHGLSFRRQFLVNIPLRLFPTVKGMTHCTADTPAIF